MQIAGIKAGLMAGKDWAAIAKTQQCILANDTLDSSIVQGLLETVGVLADREEESHVLIQACRSILDRELLCQ